MSRNGNARGAAGAPGNHTLISNPAIIANPPPPDKNDRPQFVLVLRPLPGVDAVRSLRAALKVLLRRFGLRAVSIEERQP